MITREQIKAARKLLGWSQMTLALESGLATTTIGSIEIGRKSGSETTLSIIRDTFEQAGVEFLEDELARLKSTRPP
jgi:transcriptional regulator with XRE-family HTH domain